MDMHTLAFLLSTGKDEIRLERYPNKDTACRWWSVYNLSSMLAPEDKISKVVSSFFFCFPSKRSGPRSLLNASASKCDVGHGTCDSGGPISPTPSVTRLTQ